MESGEIKTIHVFMYGSWIDERIHCLNGSWINEEIYCLNGSLIDEIIHCLNGWGLIK